LSIEELARQAGRGAIANLEILTKPITPEDATDPAALEAKRKELLATAERFANTAVVMLEERQDAEEVMTKFLERERQVIGQSTPSMVGNHHSGCQQRSR
jgi:hypothetical protein